MSTVPVIPTYREFWPFYLNQHSHPWTRRLHVFGTLLGIAVGIYLYIHVGWAWSLSGFFVSYLIAWISHFAIEKNKPATFTYPFWSFISDFRMIACFFTGQL